MNYFSSSSWQKNLKLGVRYVNKPLSFLFGKAPSIYFEVGYRSYGHLCFGLNLGLSLLNDLAVVKAHMNVSR